MGGRVSWFVQHGDTITAAAGWVSLGFGLPLVTFPRQVAPLFGLGARPHQIRVYGVLDVLLAFGLLRGRDRAGWLRARAGGDLVLAALCARAVATDPQGRKRAAALLPLMLILATLGGVGAAHLAAEVA